MLLRGDVFLYLWMVRCDDDIGDTKYGIDSGGKYLYIRTINSFEKELTSFTFANPVSLLFFDTFWPIQSINIREESVSIFCDSEYPLTDGLFLDGSSAAFTLSIHDFFVCETSLAAWTEIYRLITLIGEPCLKELEKYPLRPFIILGARRIYLAIPIK